MSDEQEYGMVLPFVACRSKGGTYDDEAFVAGYEMGLLDATLGQSAILHSPLVGWTLPLHAPNRAQADLIAMKNGFTMKVEATEYDEWIYATFERPLREDTP